MNKSKNYRCIISFYLIYLTNMSSFLIMISTCTSSQPYVTSIPRLKTKGQTNLLDENWFPVYRFIKKLACSAAISYPPKKIFEFCQRKKNSCVGEFWVFGLGHLQRDRNQFVRHLFSCLSPLYVSLFYTMLQNCSWNCHIFYSVFYYWIVFIM